MPQDLDDWGMVRGPDGMPVANAGMMARYTEEEAQHARRTGTCPPTVEANGRVIAAAPELLDSLVEVLRHLEADDHSTDVRVIPGAGRSLDAACIKAVAVISKASGS